MRNLILFTLLAVTWNAQAAFDPKDFGQLKAEVEAVVFASQAAEQSTSDLLNECGLRADMAECASRADAILTDATLGFYAGTRIEISDRLKSFLASGLAKEFGFGEMLAAARKRFEAALQQTQQARDTFAREMARAEFNAVEKRLQDQSAKIDHAVVCGLTFPTLRVRYVSASVDLKMAPHIPDPYMVERAAGKIRDIWAGLVVVQSKCPDTHTRDFQDSLTRLNADEAMDAIPEMLAAACRKIGGLASPEVANACETRVATSDVLKIIHNELVRLGLSKGN